MILLLLSCGGPAPPPPAPLPTATLGPAAEGTLPVAAGAARTRRRMDLGQLDASIRVATGGIGWDGFEELAGTLGVPDWRETTIEDRSAGVLFQKFLADAAADVCTRLVDREATAKSGNVFLVAATVDDTDPVDVAENLSLALLRFHGRSVPAGDPALAPWTFLYDSAVIVSGDPAEAWRTVCVALLVHPDFYGY